MQPMSTNDELESNMEGRCHGTFYSTVPALIWKDHEKLRNIFRSRLQPRISKVRRACGNRYTETYSRNQTVSNFYIARNEILTACCRVIRGVNWEQCSNISKAISVTTNGWLTRLMQCEDFINSSCRGSLKSKMNEMLQFIMSERAFTYRNDASTLTLLIF